MCSFAPLSVLFTTVAATGAAYDNQVIGRVHDVLFINKSNYTVSSSV